MISVATRMRANDRERAALFEDLVRKTHRQAYGFAYRLTGDAAEAEDVMGTSVETVRSRIHPGRKRLRETLAGVYGGQG